MIALDDADATERFGQAPCDFGVYFRSRAEDRSDRGKGLTDSEAKKDKYAERNQSHERADLQKNHQGENSGHQSAQEFHETSADEIANAFDVAHDSGNEFTGLMRIIVGDRQPADMRLDALAHIGNHSLCGLGEQLRKRKGGKALN